MPIASTAGQRRSPHMYPQAHLRFPLQTISAPPQPPSPRPTHALHTPTLVDSPHQSSSSAPLSPPPSPHCASLPLPKSGPPTTPGRVLEHFLRQKLTQLAQSVKPAPPSRRSSRSQWWSLRMRTALSALESVLLFVRGSIGTANAPWWRGKSS